ncbi:MAG TPA: glycosyltransferase [Gemmataceae bacterium]|nr:glycosyltransferase [Gemmataceae bacterium]
MQPLTMPQQTAAPRTTSSHTWEERAASPRPVRVCFLIDELATAGTETQLLALIRHLDRRRVRPYLVLLRGDNPVSQALEPDHCPILRLGAGALRHPATFARAWRFMRFLRRERIDVLQVYFPDSTYFGLPAAWLAGVRHRVRTRNNLGHWLTPLHRGLGRMFNALATQTIANCAAARQALLEAERPRPESVLVLHNGVDLSRFRDMPSLAARPASAEKRVGVVANLRSVKGLDVFVRAAAQVRTRHPQVMFEVAGEGELRAALEQQAAAEGLAERFTILGSVADVPGFLGRLDVAVLCSHAEGMSNALLEYMAAGRAIVATAVGAATELIEDGVHGLLVPPGDTGRLAEAMGRLLDDPNLAQRLGDAARRRTLQRHSREAMVRRFEDFYEGLIHA